ncbi:sulfurtransferase [Arthrobacter sp. NPDC056691]|uniref:sulfurtransferase n=1 Tax=Arthrobacter sp. NPDC056691 TaxID=3345913 RepID=UPI0036720944
MEENRLIPPFVDLDWCAGQQRRIVLADTRWYLDGAAGRDAYDRGHLPGAVFVDLDRWLSGPASEDGGRNPLPDPAVFAAGMQECGIEDSDLVVAYDDAGGVIAARLVWMLRATGHHAAVLDGGIASYAGPLETEAAAAVRSNFTERPWPEHLLADISDATSPAFQVIDARNLDRYLGQHDPVDPRPGHIPGAQNVPCRKNLDAGGQLLSEAQLLGNFQRAGIESADRTVSYCGSGVTACHNLLVLEHLGLGRGRLFVGGWSQYSHAVDLPVATA